MHMVKWGVQLVASEPPRAPGYYNTLAFSRVCLSFGHANIVAVVYKTPTRGFAVFFWRFDHSFSFRVNFLRTRCETLDFASAAAYLEENKSAMDAVIHISGCLVHILTWDISISIHEGIRGQIEVRECLLSFGAECFVFQFDIQKFKDQDI